MWKPRSPRRSALAFIVALQVTGHGTFTNHGAGHIALMILSGVVTARPAAAVRRRGAAGCRW